MVIRLLIVDPEGGEVQHLQIHLPLASGWCLIPDDCIRPGTLAFGGVSPHSVAFAFIQPEMAAREILSQPPHFFECYLRK
jgi:hypothetical protein